MCFAGQLYFPFFFSLHLQFNRSALLARRGRCLRRCSSEMNVKCRSCSRLHMIKDERTSRLVVIVYSEDFQRTGTFFFFFSLFICSVSLSRRTKTNPHVASCGTDSGWITSACVRSNQKLMCPHPVVDLLSRCFPKKRQLEVCGSIAALLQRFIYSKNPFPHHCCHSSFVLSVSSSESVFLWCHKGHWSLC